MTYRKLPKKLRNKLLKIIVVRLIKNDRYIFLLLILPIFKLLPIFKPPVIIILDQMRGHQMDMGMGVMDLDMDFHFWWLYRCFMVGVLVMGAVWPGVGL
jgi:hypothetical protein